MDLIVQKLVMMGKGFAERPASRPATKNQKLTKELHEVETHFAICQRRINFAAVLIFLCLSRSPI